MTWAFNNLDVLATQVVLGYLVVTNGTLLKRATRRTAYTA